MGNEGEQGKGIFRGWRAGRARRDAARVGDVDRVSIKNGTHPAQAYGVREQTIDTMTATVLVGSGFLEAVSARMAGRALRKSVIRDEASVRVGK